MNNTFITVIIILTHIIYLFVGNFGGQIIINNGADLYQATYNALWYRAPVSTQKLLLFIMKKASTYISLSYFDILVASLQDFATVMSMALSYFMVIYSVQQK
ncbi:hypothetical protein PUN28_005054 [Cardiocondyla obscurior]|uniref:Uncharacterized protein n=1 Tax=Cardiocondyla obscurior TaxID=286306 RepID=A0AAW2GDX7_9HYME